MRLFFDCLGKLLIAVCLLLNKIIYCGLIFFYYYWWVLKV